MTTSSVHKPLKVNESKTHNSSDKKDQVYTKWLERVQIVQIIYSFLIEWNPKCHPSFAQQFLNQVLSKYQLNAFQTSVLEYAFNNIQNIESNQIKPNIKESWFLEQINLVNLAIIIEAYAESQVVQTPKKILIDQSIITAKKFCDDRDYKFINALLDKIL